MGTDKGDKGRAKKVKIKIKDPKLKESLTSTKRMKIRKKKINRHEIKEEKYNLEIIEGRKGDSVNIGVKGLKLSKTEKEFLREILEKLPKRKKYIHEKCNFVYEGGRHCSLNAIGHGQFCKLHGGSHVSDGAHDILTGGLQAVLQKNSKFNPAQHPMDFLKYSKLGFSDVEIAAEFQVSHGTLMSWVDKFQMMGEAYEIGQAMYESWWLKKGIGGLDDTRNFNTSLYKYLVGNKLGYTEKVEGGGANIHNNFGVLVVPNQQTVEEWEKQSGMKVISSVNSAGSTGSTEQIEHQKGVKVPVKQKAGIKVERE